jgi:hypothetical protein
MTDIVERLRDKTQWMNDLGLQDEAADEIERLRLGHVAQLEAAAVWLRREQAGLILRMNRYADRFEKHPGKEPHAEVVRHWVKELDDIAAALAEKAK